MEQGNTPLARKVKFWFQNYQKTEQKSDFAHTLQPIATASTLQQFWAYYQHLRRPSHIQQHHNLYVFQDSITPLWQDPTNKTGGAFTLSFEKSKCDRIWEDILLSFISHETEEAKLVNGIRLKIRKDVATIQVWVRTNEQEGLENIKRWLLEAVGLRDDTHVDFMSFY